MPALTQKNIGKLIQTLSVLIVEDGVYMRKVIRNLLTTLGIKRVAEAGDGLEGLDAIREIQPDVVLLDWEMPLLNGAELVRIVRSPGVFPTPDLPIIVVSAHCERWRVVEAMRLGVNDYLIKPVSAQSLQARLRAIVTNPCRVAQLDGHHGPEPRRLLSAAVDRPTEPPAA